MWLVNEHLRHVCDHTPSPMQQAVEPREDYSHLPPEQQKRKLQQKVDHLEATLSKANADKYVALSSSLVE